MHGQTTLNTQSGCAIFNGFPLQQVCTNVDQCYVMLTFPFL